MLVILDPGALYGFFPFGHVHAAGYCLLRGYKILLIGRMRQVAAVCRVIEDVCPMRLIFKGPPSSAKLCVSVGKSDSARLDAPRVSSSASLAAVHVYAAAHRSVDDSISHGRDDGDKETLLAACMSLLTRA